MGGGRRMQWMTQTFVHVLPGLAALSVTAVLVLRTGGPKERQAMTAVLACWLAATLGQILTGGRIEPLIAGDVVFAAWLLWFTLRNALPWLYALLGVEASRLLLHTSFYQPGAPVSDAYRLCNNALSLAALGVLAVAAWRRRTQAQRRPSDGRSEA